MRTTIKNGLIVTFINEGYHSVKMKYADILVEDERIIEIREKLPEEGKIIDAKGKLVLPGLINIGSSCAAAKLLCGLIPDYKRYNWQGSMNYSRIQPMLDIACKILDKEEKEDIMIWAMRDAVSTGTTTLVDMCRPEFVKAAEKAAADIGLRAWVVSNQTAGEFPSALQDGKLICKEPLGGSFSIGQKRNGLVTNLDGLYSIETTSETMWKQASIAKDSQPLFLYGGYSHYENQISRVRYGKSPIAVLNDNNVLGKRTVLLDCFYTDFYDRERLRTAASNVSLSAVGAMHDAHTLPIVAMLRQDINTALGTGYYGMSMLDEMKVAAFGGKLETGIPSQYQASDAFYASTVAGARILDESSLGRLDIGFYADIMIVNIDRLRPVNYPLISLIYYGLPQDIENVMVGGKIIHTHSDVNKKEFSDLGMRIQKISEKVWDEARKTLL